MYLLSHQNDLKKCLLEELGCSALFANDLTEAVHFLSQRQPLTVFWDLAFSFGDESPIRVLRHLYAVAHLPVVVVGTPQQISELPDSAVNYISYVLEWPSASFQLKHLKAHLERQQELSQELASTQQRLLQILLENRALRQRVQSQPLDPQTGLLNRAGFLLELEKEWRRAHRHAYPISVLHISCQAVDTEQLIDIANQLNAVRLGDCVGRYSERDFMILLPMTFREGAEAFSAHLKHRLLRLLAATAATDTTLIIQSQTQIPRSHQDAEPFLASFFKASAESELLSLSV